MYGAKGSKHYNRPKKEEVVTDRKYLRAKNLQSLEKLREKYTRKKQEASANGQQSGAEVMRTDSGTVPSRPLSSKSCQFGRYSFREGHEKVGNYLTSELSRSKSDMNLAKGSRYEEAFPKMSRFPTIANNATLIN